MLLVNFAVYLITQCSYLGIFTFVILLLFLIFWALPLIINNNMSQWEDNSNDGTSYTTAGTNPFASEQLNEEDPINSTETVQLAEALNRFSEISERKLNANRVPPLLYLTEKLLKL